MLAARTALREEVMLLCVKYEKTFQNMLKYFYVWKCYSNVMLL